MSKQVGELKKYLGSVNEEIEQIQEYIKKIDSKRSKAVRKGDFNRANVLLEVQKMVVMPERSGRRRLGSGRPPKKKGKEYRREVERPIA